MVFFVLFFLVGFFWGVGGGGVVLMGGFIGLFVFVFLVVVFLADHDV